MVTIGQKMALATLPVASTSFLSDATFEHPGGEALPRFEFERDGVAYRGGLQFGKVRAFRFCAEGHCLAWHVEGVCDTLAGISGSRIDTDGRTIEEVTDMVVARTGWPGQRMDGGNPRSCGSIGHTVS